MTSPGWRGENGAIYHRLNDSDSYEVIAKNRAALDSAREHLLCPCAEEELGKVYILTPLRKVDKDGPKSVQ